jgi:hypothetical protein
MIVTDPHGIRHAACDSLLSSPLASDLQDGGLLRDIQFAPSHRRIERAALLGH